MLGEERAHDARELGELIRHGGPSNRKIILSCTYVAPRPDSPDAATALSCGLREALEFDHRAKGTGRTRLRSSEAATAVIHHTFLAAPRGRRPSCRCGLARIIRWLQTVEETHHANLALGAGCPRSGFSANHVSKSVRDSSESERMFVNSAELASVKVAQIANRNAGNRPARWHARVTVSVLAQLNIQSSAGQDPP